MSSKTMAEKENSSPETPSLIPSLPEDVIIDILARVSRWEYPTLSLVSKQFRSLVASSELYSRRSLLGCTEHCLYIVFYDRETNLNRWYILRQKANGNRSLVLIPSLPTLTRRQNFVAVGSKIYVIGGITPSWYSIDCTSHTVQPLPSSPVPMSYTIANIIDEKIYVMGCMPDFKNGIMVFNTKAHMWEPELLKEDNEEESQRPGLHYEVYGCVVMADKMYVRDLYSSSVYDPKKNIWRWDDMLGSRNWMSACVVGDILYYYDHGNNWFVNIVRTYDPEQRCWGVVKGLEELLSEILSLWRIHTANYGGNLVLFFAKTISRRDVNSKREIWCAEVSLERRHGGEIWGKVEWCGQVLDARESIVMESLDVMV